MVIAAGHRWRFLSATGKTIATRQGTANTGSRIMAVISAIGVPMTVDTSIKAILEAIVTIGMGMVIDITANGNPMTGDTPMNGGANTVVMVAGDNSPPVRGLPASGHRQETDDPGHVWDGCPGLFVKKNLDIRAFLTYIATHWRNG
jgi:hypothetical protein